MECDRILKGKLYKLRFRKWSGTYNSTWHDYLKKNNFMVFAIRVCESFNSGKLCNITWNTYNPEERRLKDNITLANIEEVIPATPEEEIIFKLEYNL
jgi:hypothetical protein